MKITVQKVVKGLRYLKHYGFKEFVIRLQEKMEAENIPYGPWYENHKAKEEDLKKQRKTAAGWKDAPKISIVVPLYCTKEQFLREMIESVQAQTYPNWQLCLADGSPASDADGSPASDAVNAPLSRAGSSSLGDADGSPADSGFENTGSSVAESRSENAGKNTVGNPGRNLSHIAACSPLEKIVQEYASSDTRIVYRHLEKNLGIAQNTNAAIALADGDWIAFLDHDDLLAPDALYEMVSKVRCGVKNEDGLAATGFRDGKEAAEYELVYTDEDKVDMEGNEHFQPHFKPDINIDLLRSNNYITHFTMVKRNLLEKAGSIRTDYDGAQDYDFILRCVEQAEAVGHVPRILYHWRCHQESTSENPFSKQYAVDAGKRAIEAHLKRLGVAGEVSATKDMGFYTVHYPVQGQPLVSIIIPNKDEVESLKKCLASIEKASYTNYEVIIVENNSSAETFAYYRSIAPAECIREQTSKTTAGMAASYMEGKLGGGQRVCVAVWKEGFNYSKLNNFGVSFAKGSYLVLMNNDIEMMEPEWLSEMLGTCQRNEVGIVGAKLFYPDNTVQHAGIVVGVGGNARGIGMNMFAGLAAGRSGYLHKASLAMDYSAVTAACLMVKRELYEAAGGFTEKLSVAFNDVDFCLKVRKCGKLVVYQPRVTGWHYESKSRGAEDSPEKVARFQTEIDYMRECWISILKGGDPYYNPNFSPIYNNYSLRDNSSK